MPSCCGATSTAKRSPRLQRRTTYRRQRRRKYTTGSSSGRSACTSTILPRRLGTRTRRRSERSFTAPMPCYREWPYACAYLEKKYPKILAAYRDGEPGVPMRQIRDLPPYRSRLSGETIARVVALREEEKASYSAIARELRMTPEKAKHTYDWFYHRWALKLLAVLEENAGSHEEKAAVSNYYFTKFPSSKKC